MVIVLPFSAGDLSLALANLSLIQSLGGVAEFHCLLVADERTPYAEVQRAASMAFGRVEVLQVPNVPVGKPYATNVLFERVAYHMATVHPGQSFLWLEPDVTPTRPTWLREIAASYIACSLPFMGIKQPVFDARGQFDGEALNSVAVYPSDLYFDSDLIRYLPVNPSQPPVHFSIKMMHEINSRSFKVAGGSVVGVMNSPLFALAGPNLNLRVPALVHGAKDDSIIKAVRESANFTPVAVSAPVQSQLEQALPHVVDSKQHEIEALKARLAELETLGQYVGKGTYVEQGKALRTPMVSQFDIEEVRAKDPVAFDVALEHQKQIAAEWRAKHIEPTRVILRPEPYAPIAAESFAHAPIPIIPPEPTTQAELNAARMAQGGFGDEDIMDAVSAVPTGIGVDFAHEEIPAMQKQSTVSINEVAQIAIDKVLNHYAEKAWPQHADSEQAKIEAVKADYRNGMKWKDLLKTHKLPTKRLKEITSEVDAEEPVAA